MGYDFEVVVPEIDEKAIRSENPKELVLKIAEAKNQALRQRIKGLYILITADQVVVWNGQIREKPINIEQAREFLQSYAKYPAETYSALVVINTETKKTAKRVDVAKIYFRPIPEEIIDKLIAKGDVLRSSGGFVSEDPLLEPYIARVEGTMDSIMGLPKKLTQRLIQKVGG